MILIIQVILALFLFVILPLSIYLAVRETLALRRVRRGVTRGPERPTSLAPIIGVATKPLPTRPMQFNSFKVSGPRRSLEDLRSALLAEPQVAQILVTDATAEPDSATREPVGVPQAELGDVTFAFAVHITAGVAAQMVYNWLQAWLRSRADAARVRLQEIPPASPPDTKSSTSN
jgi:hypothetical protein